ncbi:hypothetical protein CL6EHI_171290 [Entamoeba histolytica]|uniref:Uncharacterized protein n=4 Tax=Entamoeba histolytica TaxID=5759 RepID=C4M6P1_ENTH1|nr:hypothetical protein EHI_171290 [Entamoeba histolytica HM-1:IMSS]EAL44560.1 hypothetical protein EHI_171290 [Entamoeba histolytica HM-1:IMSS]ENY63343.1 hypothetical protein EHI7A_086730 [Entamoeba histolytica HM-1:IMSS-A]GAT97164.1 hypothetical protein CL6EHI_171290 [Entamoeba histolytica]|eukprot:XP_649949.1 hypothetical protein EHI_171290 [Entamoeba histolytica HM-1:IMSS]
MTTPDTEVMSMLRAHPQGCLETDKSDFIIKAIEKIKERSLVDVDLPICFVIGVAKHPRTHEKVLIIAMNGKRHKTHILKFYLVSSKMEMSVYCYFKLEEQFHGGVDINDFSLYTACFSDSLNGIVVLEMKSYYKTYLIINQADNGRMEELIPVGYNDNKFIGQIEIMTQVIDKETYFIMHTQDSLWTVSISNGLFSKKIQTYNYPLGGESCCFALRSKNGILIVTSKDVYQLIPFQPLIKTQAKYHASSLKTFIEMYTRYRKLNEKGSSISTSFIKQTNDYSQFISTTTFPLIEPQYLCKLPESRIKRPIIKVVLLDDIYYYIFILKAIVWICNDKGVLHSLDPKGSPYESIFIDSDFIFFVSDQRVSIYDFHPGHSPILVESMKSLNTSNLLHLRRLDTNVYIDDNTFNLFQLDYNPHFFVEHLYSPSPYRSTFLHLLFQHNVTLSQTKDVPFTIVPFLPIKFENITADYLIDFFTYGIPAEIRCSKLKGLPPQQMEHYFQALFFFPISYDVKSIKEQLEICEIRLPLFGRLPTEKKERIRTPMERNIWEKEFKKCLNLIFLNSFSVEGQNLKGQEEFVRKYDELLNHCISHCYTNFDNYLKEKYKNQIGVEEEKHTYNLILEKIHFYACIEDCLHQFGLQARQRETVDALVIDAYHVLPFRVFTQCVLSGCLKISPMAYCTIVNSMPPTSQNSDLEKLFNWTLWKEIPINAKKPIKKEALYIRNECYVKYIKNLPPPIHESSFFETETDPEVLFRRSLFGYCIRTNSSSSDLPISSDVIQYLMK